MMTAKELKEAGLYKEASKNLFVAVGKSLNAMIDPFCMSQLTSDETIVHQPIIKKFVDFIKSGGSWEFKG